MPAVHTAHLVTHQTSVPGSPEYELFKYMFCESGESPRTLMGHAVEWQDDAVAWLELAIIVEHIPDDVLDLWAEGYRYALEHELPLRQDWQSAGKWWPEEGDSEWVRRSSCKTFIYDDDHIMGAHVVVNLRTPRPYLPAMAAFAA